MKRNYGVDNHQKLSLKLFRLKTREFWILLKLLPIVYPKHRVCEQYSQIRKFRFLWNDTGVYITYVNRYSKHYCRSMQTLLPNSLIHINTIFYSGLSIIAALVMFLFFFHMLQPSMCRRGGKEWYFLLWNSYYSIKKECVRECNEIP